MIHETITVGTPIPEKTNIRWEGAKPIRHFVYHLRQASDARKAEMNLPEHALVLFKVERTVNPPAMAATVDEMAAYASQIAKTNADYWERKDERPSASGVNIDADAQCWILIELQKTINWRFSTSHPAVTTKAPEPAFIYNGETKYGFNANLRYAYEDGTVVDDPGKGPPGVNCRFVFFRLMGRPDKVTQGMNFVVELYTVVRGGVAGHVIPIIIDPDIPEPGTSSFPSPP
jgi:hypothetical protein